jgi:Holliday junction resolvasome RuvABC endonuclease subunit
VIIIGLDPGILKANPAGWAVLKLSTTDMIIEACGVYAPPSEMSWEARTILAVAHATDRVRHHEADAVACEDAYLGASAQVFRQLVAFAWEARVQARLLGAAFALVNPADQARVRKTLPRSLVDRATEHVKAAHRPHVESAIAIALHGAGLLRRAELQDA